MKSKHWDVWCVFEKSVKVTLDEPVERKILEKAIREHFKKAGTRESVGLGDFLHINHNAIPTDAEGNPLE